MMRKWPLWIAFGLAGAASALAPIHASACTPVAITEVISDGPPPNWREECRAIEHDVAGFRAGLDEDGDSRRDIAAVARALSEGTNGCRKRPGRALELIDAAIGTPVTMPGNSDAVVSYLTWSAGEAPNPRKDEVLIGSWITNANYVSGFCTWRYVDALPQGYTEAEVRSFLLRPDYWAIAIEKFGNNPARDRLILRELIDPASDRFNLAQAAQLAPRVFGGERRYPPDPIFLDVAEAVADPRLGAPDYEAAAVIVDQSSYIAYTDMDPEQSARVRSLWTRIAQTRLTHPDPKIRREALFMLDAGDPSARPGVPFEAVVPQGFEVIQIDEWPAGLAPPTNLAGAAARIADNYPSRALRQYEQGRVELGILFGADGKYRSVHVTRSASETLDAAATRGAERYLRPRLNELVLDGFEGRYVYVPLPAIEYRLTTVLDAETGGLVAADGATIVIRASPYRPPQY